MWGLFAWYSDRTEQGKETTVVSYWGSIQGNYWKVPTQPLKNSKGNSLVVRPSIPLELKSDEGRAHTSGQKRAHRIQPCQNEYFQSRRPNRRVYQTAQKYLLFYSGNDYRKAISEVVLKDYSF